MGQSDSSLVVSLAQALAQWRGTANSSGECDADRIGGQTLGVTRATSHTTNRLFSKNKNSKKRQKLRTLTLLELLPVESIPELKLFWRTDGTCEIRSMSTCADGAARISDNNPMTLFSNDDEEQQQIIRPFEWLTSPHSLKELIEREVSSSTTENQEKPPVRALHVGSGSSTLGEFLVEDLGFSVVNCDKDAETLQKMEQRWNHLHATKNSDNIRSRLEFCTVDFCSDHIPYPAQSFDLVLDKSTLDCTLCSDRSTARLLVEVYRALAPGGVYILISFHPIEMLRPLLEDLPGTDWQVSSSTMQRQLEDFLGGTTTVSYATHDSTQAENLLNVLIARKDGSSKDADCYTLLDLEQVMDHVHRTNDAWFQTQHPLITRARKDELERAFGDPQRTVPLSEAYTFLFTPAEREHLDYECFLEDWEAFLSNHHHLTEEEEDLPRDCLSFSTAVLFLEAMQ